MRESRCKRSHRCRRKFGKHLCSQTKCGAEQIIGELDRAGRVSLPTWLGEVRSAVRFDRSRSAVIYESKRRIARRIARLSRTTCARIQAFIERWIARHVFLLTSCERSRLCGGDRRCASRRAAIGAKAATFRAGARSSRVAELAGDGILQRLSSRDDAGTIKKNP